MHTGPTPELHCIVVVIEHFREDGIQSDMLVVVCVKADKQESRVVRVNPLKWLSSKQALQFETWVSDVHVLFDCSLLGLEGRFGFCVGLHRGYASGILQAIQRTNKPSIAH